MLGWQQQVERLLHLCFVQYSGGLEVGPESELWIEKLD